MQFYNLGMNNDTVANNTGPGGTTGGIGFNLVNVVNGNTDVGNQTLGPGNGGFNNVFLGNNNDSVGNNIINPTNGLTGSEGDNLLVAGNGNDSSSGNNQLNGANSVSENVAFLGNNNGASGRTLLTGSSISNLVATNLAVEGNGNFDTGNIFSFVGIQTVVEGGGGRSVGGNFVSGTGSFGSNFAIVGANGDSVALNSVSHTGGGINIAIELPGATNVGNCAAAACVNIFGIQLI